ncbi:MBL fold metallo-hydrolase [Candidatus Pacearchaeota archaeon]|nr:MBL fold metallo-hydrolase [Candidatus Pacearchaeota archaeon]
MIYKNIDLKWLGHSSFLIKTSFGNIYIDPYQLVADEDEAFGTSARAEVIFITHSHYDHCSIEDIRKIAKDGTIIICPADSASKFSRIDKKIDIRIAEPGTTMEFFDSKLRFWTIPAYNINKNFHTREDDWNGYIVQIGETKIYHAGDTDLIPEMKKLEGMGVDLALLPIGGTFTMNAGEAAKAASIIKPKLVVPIHYGSVANTGERSDADIFAKYCSQYGIEVKILEKN